MSRKFNFLYKSNNNQELNHINFMNFFLNKKKIFFRNLFSDFILLFEKKFSKFFYCNVNIQFIRSYIKYHHIYMKSLYIKYIGKQFMLRDCTDKCLILITQDLFIIFINYLFGHVNENTDEYCNYKNLTLHEIKILDLLLQKIFIICDLTFLSNISTSSINNCKYYSLNDFLFTRFIKFPYICFEFNIYIKNRINVLKIYIPNCIVEKFYK
ncbi:Flagellar motor switch protein FliM [Buchnera aphidicola (Cinara cuneomaculata)]|uniref:Flagellar motor switch protein FliM n=1 Tax=Buchnera aphidicola (Cinara cuneomaculata) TaxID=1660040 RepID=A0A451CXE1_9GAMM|nr:hypothetical protein [Buchnera aphidicola]VFP78032.1 Flagellar motor switch protein FliM [Buchnera aphidicola (Cinara cuneomaculata)]